MDSRAANPRLSESGAFGLVGLSASWVMTIGLAAVIPTVLGGALPLPGAPERRFAGAVVLIGGILAAAGFLVRRLVYLERPMLPVERGATDGEILARPPILVGAIVLMGVACTAMLPYLLPAASLFAEGIAATQGAGVWRKAMHNPLFTLTVLLPTMGALLIPALQVVAGFLLAAGVVVTSLLVSARSLRAPRAFLLCLILQAALALTCVYAASLADGVGASIEREVRGGRMADLPMAERYELLQVMERYDDVVETGASALKWTLLAYLLAAPLFLSLTRETAAGSSLDARPNAPENGPASEPLPTNTRPTAVTARVGMAILIALLLMLLATKTIGPLTILGASGLSLP